MAKNKLRLGRGLSSLLTVSEPANDPADLGEAAQTPNAKSAPVTAVDNALFHVELSRVRQNPHQPRRMFDEGALQGLADSLRQSGLIQPIVIRSVGDEFELVAGERRLRAAKLAGLDRLPAILRQVESVEQAELALIENTQRADLNPIERAAAYRHLLDVLKLTQEDLAHRLGEDRSTVANHLRLLDLCEPVRRHVASNTLSLGHAKLLAGVHDLLRQEQLGEGAVRQGLSVRALEQLIQAERSARPVPPPASAHIGDLERRLSRDLQMRVQVRQAGAKGKGRLIIHYGSLDQFDDLIEKLGLTTGD